MSRPDDQCTRCLQMGHRASQCKIKMRSNSEELERIRQRCRIVGKCWVWVGCYNSGSTPLHRFRGGPSRSVRHTVLELEGRPLQAGFRVMCADDCEKGCVHPDHLVTGDGSWYVKELVKRGHINTPSHKAARTNASRKRYAGVYNMTVERAQEIRMQVQGGMSRNEVSKQEGIPYHLVNKIVRGECWTDRAVPQSSVFAWAAANAGRMEGAA